MLNFHSRKFRNCVLILLSSIAVVSLVVWGTAAGGSFPAGRARTVKPQLAKPAGNFHPAAFSAASSETVSSCPAPSSAPLSSTSAAVVSVPATREPDNRRRVYLTFDDGPSSLTRPLLDVLDRYGVKATFFVVGIGEKEDQVADDLVEIARRGHAIGVHSYTHDYHQVYASPEAFFKDFDKIHDLIRSSTGIDTKICRLPGGSVNGYNRLTRKAILAGLQQRGYVYYDWNASSGDAGSPATPQQIMQNALQGIHAHRTSVVLFHNTDAKKATLAAIPEFLVTLQKEGCTFCTLDPSVDNAPFVF